MILTAAIGTNWVTTLRMSTVHVGDLGSFVTVQLDYRSPTWSGSACMRFGWLAAVKQTNKPISKWRPM